MGKIKTKLIKRTSEKLIKTDIKFNENFDNNKKILSDTMPSKKIRNQIAGYITTLKKREKKSK
jgi:ribosomal protein S17E